LFCLSLFEAQYLIKDLAVVVAGSDVLSSVKTTSEALLVWCCYRGQQEQNNLICMQSSFID